MNEELAKRAVGKHWRWVAGMQSSHGARYLGGDCWVDKGAGGVVYADANDGELPDLDDPATLGCLLALVREAWGDDGITTSCTRCGGGTGWSVHRSSPVNGVSALVPVLSESEATVLICALEAAP